MQLREFYEQVLPPKGIYSLFRSGSKRHRWFGSIADLTSETAASSGTDIYFAVASFKEAGDDFKGRTQDNVSFLKCFRLDLDAGPEKLAKHGPAKVYPDQRSAIQSLVDFTKRTGFAFSHLVSSGMGLHVYYVLDEAVAPAQWHPLAKKFQRFCTDNGLLVDPAVTADYARVLRPIGTTHPSGNVVSLLRSYDVSYSLEEFAAKMGEDVEEIDWAAGAQFDDSVNDALPLVQGPPKSFPKIVQRCAVMRHAFQHQGDIEEPFWRAALGVCKHTIEGVEAAHAISCRHPDYDEEQVEIKFDRWSTGPTTCETFETFERSLCEGCKYRGKIKSPVQLGALTVEEEDSLPEKTKAAVAAAVAPPAPQAAPGKPWDKQIPEGFDVINFKGKTTLVAYMDVEKKDEDGQTLRVKVTVPVTHDIFWFGQWADANDTDDIAQVVIHKIEGSIPRRYLMEQTLIASRSDFMKFLASKGIHLTTHKQAPTAMEAYAKAQLQRIKDALQRPKISDRFGVRVLEDGRLVAAQGEFLIYPDGKVERAMLSRNLRHEAEHYTVPLPANDEGRWEAGVWKENIIPSARAHVDFMKRYYGDEGMQKYQLAIMLALASPFMAFVTDGYRRGATLPPNGLSVALFSEQGGRGKTTAMRCAQLAFGSPAGLNKDNDDLNTTALARMARFSIAGTLPVNMDEMGDLDAKSLAVLVRSIANGAGRMRATRDGGLQVSSPWSLICLIGTNKSQREIIAHIRKESTAEQFRLLELDVEDMPRFEVETQNAFNRDWQEMSKHAGALGALIHLMICSTGVEKINDLVAANVQTASSLVQAVHNEAASRFQYRGLGAMLTLCDMLEKYKLMPFARQTLIDTFLKAYRSAIDFVDENVLPNDGLSLLSQMLSDFQPYTIITQTETRRSGFVHAYDVDVRGEPPRQAKARFVIEHQHTYVSVEAINDWAAEKKVRAHSMLGMAKINDILLRIQPNSMEGSTKRWASRFNLHKGMRETTGAYVNCYCFDIRKLGEKLGIPLGDVIAKAAPESNVVPLHKAS